MKYFVPYIFLILVWDVTCSYSVDLGVRGQVSGWSLNNTEKVDKPTIGIRYIPEISMQTNVRSSSLDVLFSTNINAFKEFSDPENDDFNTELYRAWGRFSTSQFECRLGLQKINFGSATILRPLMWFDRIDSRDPLQITNGVYGLLFRYYFLNNANIWAWVLYGNDDPKGWELLPTAEGKPEVGGRIQVPVLTGELAATWHHRKAELPEIVVPLFNVNSEIPEYRYGLDGKWDVGVGLWFETCIIYQDHFLDSLQYRRMSNFGLDYTINIGTGLTLTAEKFSLNVADVPFSSNINYDYYAFSLNYPYGLLDNYTGLFYHDCELDEWYRFVRWQRSYDRWQFHLNLFWNPETTQLYQNLGQQNLYSGKGFQFLIVFNH